ncbi:MAG: hypothetical protein RLZZ09_1767, partial [Pseudomonadota bacterium]
ILWAVHNWFGARRILDLLEFDKTTREKCNGCS